MIGTRGLGRRVLEAMPGSFDLGLGGPVIPRPCLGERRWEFGDVKPDDGTGCAVNESGALGGFRLRSQPKADGSNASPTWQHFSTPVSKIKLLRRMSFIERACTERA
jgi:hypothetical protein